MLSVLFGCAQNAMGEPLLPPGVIAQYAYYFPDRVYIYELREEQINKCPQWNPDTQANPPISAADALHKAQNFIQKIPEEGAPWRFLSLSLVEEGEGTWCWRAKFEPTYLTGSSLTLDCWILMDGTVLEPKVKLASQPKHGEGQRAK